MDNKLNREDNFEYLKIKTIDLKRKTSLLFAILGLLLGPFMGSGIVFSILGLASYLKNKKLGGTSLKWGLVLGIVGFVLNLAFILSIGFVIILSKIPMPL